MAKKKKTLAEVNQAIIEGVDQTQVLEGKSWRTLMGQVPELMGISPQTKKLLTSGYGKPHFVDRAVFATRMIGAQAVTEDVARWAGRVEEHHIILMKLLEPFLQGRTIKEADQIVKRASNNLGGRKLGNHPDNLRSLIKELHRKSKISAHGILKRYYDFQGTPTYTEFDEIRQYPKDYADSVFGKKFDRWYKVNEMQDGWSMEMVSKIKKLKWQESADVLSGYLDFSIPRLEGAVLASLFLDDTSRRSGYALEVMNSMKDGKKHLMETLADIKLQEQQGLAFTDPSKPMEGQTKVLTDQINWNKENQTILDALDRFDVEAEDYGLPKVKTTDTPILKTHIRNIPNNIGEHAEDLGLRNLAYAGMGEVNYGSGVAALNEVDYLTGQIGRGVLRAEQAVTKAATQVGEDFAAVGDDIAKGTKVVGESLKDIAYQSNPENYVRLVDLTKPGTSFLRRGAALMPFVGAAADAWDVSERYKVMMNDPNEGLADWLDKAQFALATGTAATTWWAEPVNFALGVGNLGIDVARTAFEEEKRADFMDTMEHLGVLGGKAIKNLF